MKKTTYARRLTLALCLAVPLAAALPGCAEEAPPLPAGASIKDVRFTPKGDIYVKNWCVTCCEDQCPGPYDCCGGGQSPGGGGGPPPHHYCPPPDVYCEGP